MVKPGDDDAVLAAPAALTPEHKPSTIVDRETVARAYRDTVAGMLDGVLPHLFVFGPSGTGKSLLTHRVLDEQLAADQRSIVISCDDGSPYSIAVKLANALDPSADALAPTGHAEQAVMATLAERFEAAAVAVVVLDDVGVEATESLLPTIADATADTGPATICITEDNTVRNELDYPLRRRLCAREIRFEPYSRDEIRQILRSRAEAAFDDERLSPEALNRCADLVQSDLDGDVGQGIRLLAFVAVVADEADATQLTVDHVERARDRLESQWLRAHLDDASPHRAGCLRAVLDRAGEAGDPPRIDDLYATYREQCAAEGIDPISKRGFHDHLRALRDAGIVTVTSHRSGTPGHYYRYYLDVAPAAVRLALTAVPEGPRDE